MPLASPPDEKRQSTRPLPEVQASTDLRHGADQSSDAPCPVRADRGTLAGQLGGPLHRQSHAPLALRTLWLAQAGIPASAGRLFQFAAEPGNRSSSPCQHQATPRRPAPLASRRPRLPFAAVAGRLAEWA